MHAVPRATAPPPPELQPYQSQVFVFSTNMANQAAEAYLVGHTPSIIAFHKNQPLTQSFIQSCLNKCEQPYPPSWQPPAVTPPPKTSKRKASKQQQQQKFVTQCPCCVPPRYGPYPPQPPPRMPLRPEMPLPIAASDQPVEKRVPSLPFEQRTTDINAFVHHGIGMKHENLTYQQRQHREERLATITQMQQLLFPEQTGPRMYPQQSGNYWNSERPPPAPYMFMPSQDHPIPPRQPAPTEPYTLGEPLGPGLDTLDQDAFLRTSRPEQFTFPPVDELVDNLDPALDGSVPYPTIEQLAAEIPPTANPIATDIIAQPETKLTVPTPDGHSPSSTHPPSEETRDVPSAPENNSTSTQQLLTPPSVPPSLDDTKASKGPEENAISTPELSADSNANLEPLVKSPPSPNANQPEKEEKDSQSPAAPAIPSGSPIAAAATPPQPTTSPPQSSSQPEGNESNGSHQTNDSNNKLQLSPQRASETKSEEASIEGIATEEIAKSSPVPELKASPTPTPILPPPVENDSSNFDGLEGINLPEAGVTATSTYDPSFFNTANATGPQQASGPLPSLDPWTNLPFKHPSYEGDLLCGDELSNRIPSFSTLQNIHHLSPPPADHRNIRASVPMDSRQLLMPNHMTPPMSPYSQVYYNSNPGARMCLQPPSAPVRTSNPQYAYMDQKTNMLENPGMTRGGGEMFFRLNAVPPLYAETPSSSSLYYAQRYSSPPCLSPALPTSIPSPADSRMCSPDNKQFCGPAATNPNYAAQFYKFQQQLYTPNPGLSELD